MLKNCQQTLCPNLCVSDISFIFFLQFWWKIARLMVGTPLDLDFFQRRVRVEQRRKPRKHWKASKSWLPIFFHRNRWQLKFSKSVRITQRWLVATNECYAWMLVMPECWLFYAVPPNSPLKKCLPPQICWPLAQIFCHAKIILLPTPTFFTPPPHFATLPFPILFLFIFYFFLRRSEFRALMRYQEASNNNSRFRFGVTDNS